MTRSRIVGVDFSGAKDAGRKIWIAEGPMNDGPWSVESCRPASELPGGARDLPTALQALRNHLIYQDRALIGCDFPFGLPEELLGHADWAKFASGFSEKYRSAEAFRQVCRGAMSGKEIKRKTDCEAKTPFCAYNLRLYRQTYHGISGLLGPLVESGRCIVMPMQERRDDASWVIETCPASTLKRATLYAPSYKGKNEGQRQRRYDLIASLVASRSLAPLSRSVKERVIEDREGDALDAIIAGLAAKAALSQLDEPVSAAERIEGKVYFKLAP